MEERRRQEAKPRVIKKPSDPKKKGLDEKEEKEKAESAVPVKPKTQLNES